MTIEETTLVEDFVDRKSVVQDDQYIEFYENNPDTIHFDPPLTLEEFGALLQASFSYGKTGKRTGKISDVGQK